MGAAVIDVSKRAARGAERGSTRVAVCRAWRDAGAAGAVMTVAAIVAVAIAAAAWVPETGRAIATGSAIGVLVVAALVDATEHRLPNALVAGAGLPVLVALAIGPGAAPDALGGAVIGGAPLLATHLISPGGMGFGDVKAGFALGAALGLVDAQLAVLALVLGLGLGAAWGLVRGARAVPLGPPLVGGAIAALAVGQLLGWEPQ